LPSFIGYTEYLFTCHKHNLVVTMGNTKGALNVTGAAYSSDAHDITPNI